MADIQGNAMRVSDFVAVAFATLILASPTTTFGCEILAHAPHTIDQREIQVDTQAPDRPEIRLLRLEAGDGWDEPGFEGSCIGDAEAQVQIDYAKDDRTDEEHMGFRFLLLEGELPKNAYFPRKTVRAYDATLSIMWGVGRSEPIEAVDFTIAVIAVDLAGNEGPPSLPIRISHPGIER